MNYLDIILWVSAVGLWVWVLIEIVSSIYKFRDKVNDTTETAQWVREILNKYTKLTEKRYYETENRLDAIEKQIKKGRK